jgi:carboxyl-terminal processing protease
MLLKSFLLLFILNSFPSYANSVSLLSVYDNVVDLTSKHFYDQTFRGLDWHKMTIEYRQRLSDSSSERQLKDTINDLLKNLKASHTEFITEDDQEYHGLRSVFSLKIEGDQLYQCGGWYQNIDGKWFVKNVFNSTPLDQAGIVSGDEIISVNGKPFAEVKSCDTDLLIDLSYRHHQFGPEILVKIRPEKKSVQQLLLESTSLSNRIQMVGSKRVGYFHLWSGTHDRFLESIQAAAKEMAEATDVLILDLRDGYGGAWTPYIQSFFDKDLESGEKIPQIYSKPIYVLINDGVRSGKEYLAFLFKKEKRAKLIGSNTAGHFLGGSLFDIVNGKYALYLAVENDPTGVLEGRGVAPDIQIDQLLPYSGGKDVQLEATLELIRKAY